MDHKQLVNIVKLHPQIWDRNCVFFRDKDIKERAWKEVATELNSTVEVCKDTFKSLREKYLREREKPNHTDNYCKQWELIDDMKFLDPHILTRASTWSGHSWGEEEMQANTEKDATNFDKKLIYLVKAATPIWDRYSNSYTNRISKNHLWENISKSLDKDANFCMLRWKALREKYIRQKVKHQDGEISKWELLDSLNFLDKVIQYRKKHSDVNYNDSDYAGNLSIQNKLNHVGYGWNVDTDDTSSNDLLISIVKEEASVQMADSSLNSSMKRARERSESFSSEATSEKKIRNSTSDDIKEYDEQQRKNPEQLFGDLVASLLSKKPENQRNLYMIEIMTVLSK